MGSILLDAFHDYGLRAMPNIDPPQLSAEVVGTPGATTLEYCAAFKTKVGETLASSNTIVTTGPGTLGSTDKVLLTVPTVPAAVKTIRFFKKVSGDWELLGDVDVVDATSLYDTGQVTTETAPAEVNTSGRPNWYAPLFHTGRYAQRLEMTDLVALIHQRLQDFGDITHRDGDIVSGLKESLVTGTTWRFTEGQVYVDGIYVRVPAGQVELLGTGTEKVGLLITPTVVTYQDDPYLRNLDEGIPDAAYDQPGADQLSFDITWVVDDPNQITVIDFIDNQPMLVTDRPERSVLERSIAQGIFDISGNCVVRNFPMQVVDHPTDATKLMLKVGPGKAYPNGFKVETFGTQSIPFDKARAAKAVNNSGTSGFSIPGGSAITSNPETYNVDGLKVSLTIGSGNAHVVTLAGSARTAAQVGEQIEAAVNAYPTSGELVICTAAGGYLEIQAVDGKNLTINTVTGDAYTILGLTAGVYAPLGTRIYEINDAFVKDVSDLSYKTPVVEQKTHNGTTHKDLLSNANVLDIVGAALTLADAHDGKWDYELGVDFGKDGDYIDFSAYGGSDPTPGGTYYVAYTYNRNATKGVRTLVQVIDAEVVKGAIGGEDGLVFTGGTCTKVIDGSVVSGLAGIAKDAVRILRVNDADGQSVSDYNAWTFNKNSTGLAHAQSTIDWGATTNPDTGEGGQPDTDSTYYVSFVTWVHTLEGDVVTADSYDVYNTIETFATLNLRDCLDFRTTGVLPSPAENPTFDYNFYLSRADKLMLSDSGAFSLITGAPGNPAPIPPEQSNVLTLAVLFINAYTYGPLAARAVSLEPMRITQTGLRKMSDRLARAEYAIMLKALADEVAQTPVIGEVKGLFSDALTGLGRMDTAFNKKGLRHTAAVDQLTRTLRLPATSQPKSLAVDLVNSIHVRRSGSILCLDYQPEVFNEQLQAAITVDCAPDYVYEDYLGVMKLNPICDSFLDTTQLPQINNDFDDQLTSAVSQMDPETFWGAWSLKDVTTSGNMTADSMILTGMVEPEGELWTRDTPIGKTGEDLTQAFADFGGTGTSWAMGSVTQNQERQGMQITPGSINVDLGNQIKDMSVVPMLRTTDDNGDPFVIHCDIVGLVPNQDHGISIGGTQCDFTYDSGADHPHGAAGTHTVGGKTTVVSDNDGRITGKFTMPLGIPNGSPLVVCSHWSIPTHSVAMTAFYGKGFQVTSQGTTIGIPNPSIQIVTDTQSFSTTMWGDPIAQTFLIPPGITYISAVGLFFKAKSSTLPITVQIRNTVNGQPGPSVFASTTLEPADVSVSDDGSAETVFTFDHVLGYLPNNEYCFVVVPGSSTTDYRLWAAELGAIDILSGNIIGPPMADGVMYHSPNNRAWEGWTKRDMKYKLYKSNFEQDCQVVFTAISGLQAAQIALAIDEFVAPGTNVKWSYCLEGGAEWVPFHPKVNIILDQVTTQVQLRVDVTSLGGSYQIVDDIAGILFLLHTASADAIWLDKFFTDPLDYPNKIVATFKTNADGIDVASGTSITPYYTVDDGSNWCKILPSADFVPTAAEEAFFNFQCETGDEASITDATNASQIVITSAGHPFQDNEIVDIAAVTGNTNANGQWRVANRTANTFEIVDPTAGTARAGNGAYTGPSGTITLAEFSQIRTRVQLNTDNQARTPEARDFGFLCSRI